MCLNCGHTILWNTGETFSPVSFLSFQVCYKLKDWKLPAIETPHKKQRRHFPHSFGPNSESRGSAVLRSHQSKRVWPAGWPTLGGTRENIDTRRGTYWSRSGKNVAGTLNSRPASFPTFSTAATRKGTRQDTRSKVVDMKRTQQQRAAAIQEMKRSAKMELTQTFPVAACAALELCPTGCGCGASYEDR